MKKQTVKIEAKSNSEVRYIKTKRHGKVKVIYTFAINPKLIPRPHNMIAEGVPTSRVYCAGCYGYFKNWTEAIKFHKKLAKEKGASEQIVHIQYAEKNVKSVFRLRFPRLHVSKDGKLRFPR